MIHRTLKGDVKYWQSEKAWRLLCNSLKRENLVLGSKRGTRKQKNQPVLGVQNVNSQQWVARHLSGAATVIWVRAAPFWLHYWPFRGNPCQHSISRGSRCTRSCSGRLAAQRTERGLRAFGRHDHAPGLAADSRPRARLRSRRVATRWRCRHGKKRSCKGTGAFGGLPRRCAKYTSKTNKLKYINFVGSNVAKSAGGKKKKKKGFGRIICNLRICTLAPGMESKRTCGDNLGATAVLKKSRYVCRADRMPTSDV